MVGVELGLDELKINDTREVEFYWSRRGWVAEATTENHHHNALPWPRFGWGELDRICV